MPELYGKPFKSELYDKVDMLQARSFERFKEVRRLRSQLLYANLKIDELEAKIKRMQEKARACADEGDQGLDEIVKRKFIEHLTPVRFRSQ